MTAPGDDRSPGERAKPGAPTAGGAAGSDRRSGRRPGESSTRADILEAARAAFAERGYDRATIRTIAGRAGVDPALVIHYFKSKEALFSAALELPIQPREILSHGISTDPERLGATVVRVFLRTWDAPENRVRLTAMLRSALTNEVAMGMIRDLLVRQVFGPIATALGVPDARLRATLAGSQFLGLAIMRYVGRLEPLASASSEEIVAAVGPTVQRYLTGDLGPGRPVR